MTPRLSVTSETLLSPVILRTEFSLSLPLRYSATVTSMPMFEHSWKPASGPSVSPVPRSTRKLNCTYGRSRRTAMRDSLSEGMAGASPTSRAGRPGNMPKPPLPDELLEMLAKPNPSVIATLRRDGSPVTTATWYLWDDGRVLVNMDYSRRRLAHMRRDPRVSITVLDDDWYRHVSLLGRVVRLEDDDG